MVNQELPFSILAHYFGATFYWGVLFVILIVFFYYIHNDNISFRESKFNSNQFILSLFLIIPIIIIFAYYPIEWGTYSDRECYLFVFKNFEESEFGDYIWQVINLAIRIISNDQFFFFAVLAVLYVGLRYIACIQFSKENNLIVFLMMLSSFMFLSYGINTIRAGVASSFLILSLSLLFKKRIWNIILIVMMLISIGIHKSMIIPATAFLLSLLFKDSKLLIVCWISAFFVSFLVGGYISNFLGDIVSENAGEQAGGYISSDEKGIYNRGFRIDFILYSLAPIVVGGYYIFKKEFFNKEYITLYNTYIITNIFFVLVIRANFVDRFGYLSWMLMPIILIYPLLKQKLFVRQNIVIAFTLLFNELFTFLMYLR